MTQEVFFNQFWPNFAGTVLGGALLSCVFFALREWIFSLPQLSGVWECELIVQETAYNPYRGMKLWYRLSIVQNGNQIAGVGEKDREDSVSGNRNYSGSARIPVSVSGKIEKNITKPDRIHIVWTEKGSSRQSSTIFDLRTSGAAALWGRYFSTIAESRGVSSWKRLN